MGHSNLASIDLSTLGREVYRETWLTQIICSVYETWAPRDISEDDWCAIALLLMSFLAYALC